MKKLNHIFAAMVAGIVSLSQGQSIPDYAPVSPGFGAPAAPMPNYGAYPPPGSGLGAAPMISPTVAPPPGAGMDMMYGAPAPMAGGDMGYTPMLPPSNAGPAPLLGGQSPAPSGGLTMLTYNYLYGGYQYNDPKANGLDGSHGLGVSLGVQLFQPFFIKASANWGSGEGGGLAGVTGADYDFASISAAGGLYMPIFENFHFLGELGLNYTSIDAQNTAVSFNDGSIFVRPAFRFQPIQKLELQAGVTVSSSDNYDSRLLDLSAYWRLMNQFDVGLGGDFGDESRAFKLGVRFRW